MRDSRLALSVRAYALAVKRRWLILTRGDFNPYPRRPDGLSFSPSEYANAAGSGLHGALNWASVERGGAERWQYEARRKFRELLALPDRVAVLQVHSEAEMPVASGYRRRRIYVRFSPGRDAPVDIVWRDGSNPADLPAVICMQGTNSGAHLNLGEVRMPADVFKVAAGSALALQAADHGYVAISFERACFGERRERLLPKRSPRPTVDAAFHLLNLGETLLGQTVVELEALRVWVSTEIAPGAPVYLAGYSAAGTAAIAAAAADPNFAGIAVGGCVGMIRDTVLKRAGGGFNDIPEVLKWFEFDAQMALISPRPCVVVAGQADHIWPYSGAVPVVESARRAWDELDHPEAIDLIGPKGGHTYYPELMWPALEQMTRARP